MCVCVGVRVNFTKSDLQVLEAVGCGELRNRAQNVVLQVSAMQSAQCTWERERLHPRTIQQLQGPTLSSFVACRRLGNLGLQITSITGQKALISTLPLANVCDPVTSANLNFIFQKLIYIVFRELFRTD